MANKFEVAHLPGEDPRDRGGRWYGEREYERSIESAADWVLGMLKHKEKYGERIPLKRDQSFDIPEGLTELPHSVPQLIRSAEQMKLSQKGLFELAKEISEKHQDLRFTFKRDPQGKWIEYSVKKQNLKVGDEVLWETEEISPWKNPKKISAIREDVKSKKKFAFFEGSGTGIPLEQLVSSEKSEISH